MTHFQKIIVNGKEVDTSAMQDLPEAVQQVLADKNKNGIPDFMEDILEHPFVKKALEKGGYSNFNQLPPEMREKLQGLVQKLGGTESSAAPQIQVGSVQVHQGSTLPKSSQGFSSRHNDWQQGFSQEQPGMVPLKVVMFAVAAILGLVIFAFVAWMTFGK